MEAWIGDVSCGHPHCRLMQELTIGLYDELVVLDSSSPLSVLAYNLWQALQELHPEDHLTREDVMLLVLGRITEVTEIVRLNEELFHQAMRPFTHEN